METYIIGIIAGIIGIIIIYTIYKFVINNKINNNNNYALPSLSELGYNIPGDRISVGGKKRLKRRIKK